MKLLLYCTKSKPYLFDFILDHYPYKYGLYDKKEDCDSGEEALNGKIVAECDFEVEKIICDLRNTKEKGFFEEYTTKSLSEKELLYASKIDEISFINYLKSKNGYAIHIKNLHIFDKPKELSEVYYRNKHGLPFYLPVKKAPQNMMRLSNGNILISIRPEWLCKILNGEKTIEVRKKVLKEMLTNEKI